MATSTPFTWEIVVRPTFHARSNTADRGSMFIPDRSLDLFQWLECSRSTLAAVMPEAQIMKGCEISSNWSDA